MRESTVNEAGNEGGSVTVALPDETEAVQKVAAAIFSRERGTPRWKTSEQECR